MGSEEEETLSKKLDKLSGQVQKGIGICIGFGVLGVVLGGIATYYMGKVEITEARSIENEKDIAIINAKEPGRAAWVRERLIWERKVDDALIRVSQ